MVLWATTNLSHPNEPLANNTVYSRANIARTFGKWLEDEGLAVDFGRRLSFRSGPLKSYRRTYGKVQAKYPARFLSRDQAFGQLIAACQDDTLRGLRDEVALRLGLQGMRNAEIRHLTRRDVQTLPVITWTGKGHKPRQMTASPGLTDAITRLLTTIPDDPDTYLLHVMHNHVTKRDTHYRTYKGKPMCANTLANIVYDRANRSDLGHVAPHDLRRACANILHTAKDDSGAHHFDLLDIQRVLGHADPAVTMKCYLAPLDTAVLDKASTFLD